MVIISKEEAAYVRKQLPQVTVRKTMKQKGSKRGHYYVEETKSVQKVLNNFHRIEKNDVTERNNADEIH